MGRGGRDAQQAPVPVREQIRRPVQSGSPAWVPQQRESTTVTSSSGRAFTIRLVRRGGRYGLTGALEHTDDDPLVEFYDATYAGDDRFGPFGQFVSRLPLSTLLGHEPGVPLDLDGGVPAWTVSADAMDQVRVFLDEQQHL